MKPQKFISAMLGFAAVLIASGIFSFSANAAALEGKGTELNPFIARDNATLNMIADFPDAYWRLESDIEVNGRWSTIGEFSGTLDGNGYKITGLSRSVAAYSFPRSLFIEYNKGTVKNLRLEGSLTIAAPDGGGLLADTNYGTIENCSVNGTITVTQNQWTNNDFGGMVNDNAAGGIIKNCYARVNFVKTVLVATYSNISWGGMAYNNDGAIVNCYAVGTRSLPPGLSEKRGCGFASYGKGSAESCYYDKNVSGCSDTRFASGKTTAAMKMEYNYADWDFAGVWAINESVNDGYPYLQCERSIDVALKAFALDKSTLSLAEGETAVLTPVFTPQNASDKTVEWSTSSRYVAAVDNGVVTGVSEGTAVITAAAGGFTASCTVTVTAPHTSPDYSCGEKLTYTFSDGTLTISGTGGMYDYSYGSLPDWCDYADRLTAVVIDEGVTSVGEWAFFNCKAIASVSIPSSLTSVGAYAFLNANGIADVYYNGSKSQWESTAVADGNSALTDAPVHYAIRPEDEIRYAVDYISAEKLGDGTSRAYFSVTKISGEGGTHTVIAASYDEHGAMTNSKLYEIAISEGQTKSFAFTFDGASEIKLFVWDSLSSMRPLSEATAVSYVDDAEY